MNKLLKNLLIKLGTPKLIELYGRDQIQFVAELSENGITASKIIDLIDKKYGSQLLSDPSIRRSIIQLLDKNSLLYVARGAKNDGSQLSSDDAERLFNMRWGASQKMCRRLVEVLDLGDHYLPPRPIHVPSVVDVKPRVMLYPHQHRVKEKFVCNLLHGQTRVMLHMPTGAGKTRTAIDGIYDYWKVAGAPRKNIIWLAHSEELCDQAFETFKSLWEEKGDQPIQIFRLWGVHDLTDEVPIGSIIVAGFQKLYSLISSQDDQKFVSAQGLKKSSSVIVVDEAHKAIAPTYKACIDFLSDAQFCKVVGLTATPGRSTNDIFEIENNDLSGSTSELAEYFHYNKIGLVDDNGDELLDPIGYLQERKFLSKIDRRIIKTNIAISLNNSDLNFISKFLELPISVLTRLAQSAERNALILGEIANLYLNGKAIIVFALSVEHAMLISDLLNLRNISAKAVDGNMSTYDRHEAINLYKSGDVRVLVNYGVLTTGFDAPNTNAIIIARPTASIVLYSQMIGRGIRGPEVGGSEECVLIDVVDNIIGFPSENQAFNHFNDAWS